MDANEFRTNLVNSINAEYTELSDKKEAFISEVINHLEDSGQCTGFSPVSVNLTGTRNRKIELDGYGFDEFDKTLSLYLCKYSGGELPEVLTKTEIERQFNKVNYFIQSIYDGSIFTLVDKDTNEYYVANYIGNIRSQIERYNFVLITDDLLSERTIKDIDIEFIDDKPTQPTIWDIKRYCDLATTDDDVEDTEIIFENYGFKGISCIKANEISKGADYTAYLCVMPAKLLSDIFDVYGGKLLESNVRSFLSTKGKVNKGIKKSIHNEPSRFFAYNNGISTTATEVDVKQFAEGPMITRIKSLQIVNGGQTTVSIYSAEHGKDKSDLSDIYVPMKICVISSENSDEITRHISEYSNSQNKVSTADFFSNAPFHIKIEKMSRRLVAPPKPGSIYPTKWYYERARGSYAQEQMGLTASQLKDFLRDNPKNQVLTKTDLARYRNTFEMFPDVVSKGPQHNIGKFAERIEEIWNSTSEHGIAGSKINDNYYKETVAMAIIFNDLDKMIADKELTPWYVSGFKQNLVIYTISKFVYELKKVKDGFEINYDRVWKEQTTPQCLKNQLHELAKIVFDALTDPGRPKELIPEYAKMKVCWDHVREIKVNLNSEISNYVISQRKKTSETRVAINTETNTQRMKSNIWIVNQGSKFWEEVLNWGLENAELTRTDIDFLKIAVDMERYRKPPTEKQAVRIVEVYNKLVDEGFRGNKFRSIDA